VDSLEIFQYYEELHEKFEKHWHNSSETEDHKKFIVFIDINFLKIYASSKVPLSRWQFQVHGGNCALLF